MDRRQTVRGFKTRLESELIPNDIRCVSFWYYLVNTVDAELNVYVRHPPTNQLNLIWSTKDPHGAFWVQKEITVRPNMTVAGASRFTVVYEGVVGRTVGGM